ncbi:MAG: hypothetical protein ACRDZQ_16860 [Acidimicrobiales bacterium]
MAQGRLWAVAADFVAWGVIQGGLGYLVHRLPRRCFASEAWLWRERAFEGAGRLYVRGLRIRRWKHLLPDAGTAFAGGFPRRRLGARDRGYLAEFLAETRRAELNHWMALLATPAFAAWNPPAAMPLLALYGLGSNLPCIAAQRYNRIRLARVLRTLDPAP